MLQRLETFCDGVFAIAITLLVLEIRIPTTPEIQNTAELWHALGRILPSICAFLLSFVIILITWVNHHNAFKLVKGSCSSFLYANGFLLLTIAFLPFPTSMLGEYILTNHAAPAVVLYNGVLALQALGWVLMSNTTLKNNMQKSEKASVNIRQTGTFGTLAFLLYAGCAIGAIWFPLLMAIITTITWLFWLVYGIRLKHEEVE